jgi:hypothetical protein
MKLSIQKSLIGIAVILLIDAAFAADSRVDVSAIINKAEAESVLATKVKDATPRNVQGGDGYYSKCNYYSVAPGKTLLLRIYQAAPGYDGRRELEMVTKNTAQVKPVTGLGDKAVATSGTKSGLPARVTMLYVSKGSNLVTVGLSGLPDEAATLEKAKSVAAKILIHL